MHLSQAVTTDRCKENVDDIDAAVTALVLAGNQADCLPVALPANSLSSLTRLDLSNQGLKALPDALFQLTQLTQLSAGGNALTALPAGIASLQALVDLDLSRNALAALPDALCALTGLKYLNLMANPLESLPEGFGNLASLYRLGLKSCRLAALPDSFTKLASLVELYVTDNALQGFPPGFGALRSLVKLQASFNSITEARGRGLLFRKFDFSKLAFCEREAALARVPPKGPPAWHVHCIRRVSGPGCVFHLLDTVHCRRRRCIKQFSWFCARCAGERRPGVSASAGDVSPGSVLCGGPADRNAAHRLLPRPR